MGKGMTDLKSLGAGVIAIWAADLVFYKGFKHFPFLNDRTILSRALLSGVGALTMIKSTGVARDAALVFTAHNLADSPYHLEQVHDFLGLSGNQIDGIASEAVASIENKLSEKISGLKAALNGEKPMSERMNGKMSERMSETVEAEYFNR